MANSPYKLFETSKDNFEKIPNLKNQLCNLEVCLMGESSATESSRNKMNVTDRVNRKFKVEREELNTIEPKQVHPTECNIAFESGYTPSTERSNVFSYTPLKIEGFETIPNVMDQSCNPEVFLKIEPKKEKYFSNEIIETKSDKVDCRLEDERENFNFAECKQVVPTEQHITFGSVNTQSTEEFNVSMLDCHDLRNAIRYKTLKKEEVEKKLSFMSDKRTSNILNFEKILNLMCQPCYPEAVLPNESTEIKDFTNNMRVTKNYRTNRMFEVEREMYKVSDFQRVSPTEQKVLLESSCNIQVPDKVEVSSLTCDDLRTFIICKNMIKEEDKAKQKSWSLSNECTNNILDFNRENNSTWNKEHIAYDETNVESVKSSPKKYPGLFVSISEGSNRKVIVQNVDLDSIIPKQSGKLTSSINTDNDSKIKFKSDEHTDYFNLKETHTKCDKLSRQLISTPREQENKTGHEGGETRIKLKCRNIDSLIDEKKINHVERKGMKDSGVESDSGSDALNKRHSNRRLQAERPANDLKTVIGQCRTHTKGNLEQCQRRGQKRKRSKSNRDSEEKEISNAGRSLSLPPVKRLKRSSDETKFTETVASINKQENLVKGKKFKSAELWTEVLSAPERHTSEHNRKDKSARRSGKVKTNYINLLNKFISSDTVKKLKKESLDFWETRFQDNMLSSTTNVNIVMEFYIPPAQVQLLHQRLTDDLPYTECLRIVCETRHWPQPVYKQMPHATGFLYTCKLKSVEFTPSKPASNHQLAQELAANNCLDWLGLRTSRASTKPSNDTYSHKLLRRVVML